MARWTASAKWATGPALDGQCATLLGLALSEGLGFTLAAHTMRASPWHSASQCLLRSEHSKLPLCPQSLHLPSRGDVPPELMPQHESRRDGTAHV